MQKKEYLCSPNQADWQVVLVCSVPVDTVFKKFLASEKGAPIVAIAMVGRGNQIARHPKSGDMG